MDNTESRDNSNKEDGSQSLEKSQPSLSSLIIWNISKALEKNPHIDLQRTMRSTYKCLERQSRDVSVLIPQSPEERHIMCAVLAWQQLGHNDTESLYEFIESHRNKATRITSENLSEKANICSVNRRDVSKRPKGFIDHKPSMYCRGVDSASFDTSSLIGPVLKLPVETKLVMRVENSPPCTRHVPKKSPKNQKNDITNKIEACCLDSACVERLKELETSTAELRTRAGKLARREAERVELLERAEAAWRDLELGYQRRLLHAEEKEDDIAKQIKKCIEDRNAYKHACTTLAQQLSKRGDIVEKDRAQLTQVEREVCDLACTRLRLSEESAKGDAAVADQQCKVVQLERDLQFREEQARRKLLSIESVADSTRGLTLEAERAMREELSTIKDHISQISNQLLEQDAENNRIKNELDELRQQKTEMFEDIEGCKQMCDNRMQDRVDELNKKRQILKELKEKAIECQCKIPLNAAVEVKRTPSLAALCRCTAEEKILHSCSCTSVRSTLLSNLLADLFEGLQAELGDTGSIMPCQLLKCLEDRHNWDRASIIKSNLRSFFSQLLVGELDTAIATSIEKYHATWVGASCADKAKLTPEPGEVESEGWQERVLENRAQRMATQLAEQLFQERADQLVQRARDIVTSGPPPCVCKPQSNKATAYPCLIKTPIIDSSAKRNEAVYPTYPTLKRTLQDVTLLRTQIEDLKKESIKKEDFKMLEEKITKIVQQASELENTAIIANVTNTEDKVFKQKKIHKSINTEKLAASNEKRSVKKNIVDGVTKKNSKKSNISNLNRGTAESKFIGKSFRKEEQSFAVNLCLCDGKKNTDGHLINHTYTNNATCLESKTQQGIIPKIHSNKLYKTMDKILLQDNQNSKTKKNAFKVSCSHNCKCFHKKPSNSSINKLLEKLLKWKGDLSNDSVLNSMASKIHRTIESDMNVIHHDSEFSNNKKSVDICQDRKLENHNVSKFGILMTTENNQIPITTSEYMGEINLDKVSDHLIDDSNIHSKLMFKCIQKNNYDCEKLMQNNTEIYKDIELNEDHVIIIDKESQFKAKPNVIEFKSVNTALINEPLNTESGKAEASFNTINKQTLEKKILPEDRDMFVKFLGVTLTDINERNPTIERRKRNKTETNEFKKQSHLSFNLTTSDKNYIACSKKKLPNDIKYQNTYDKSKYGTNINHCQFVERRSSSNESSRCDKNELSNDQCFKKIFHDTKSCVCCNYDEETKNLEFNAFYLLEKYLKHKLAELKKSSYNSYCILPDNEENFFLTILEKVKQVISSCINNLNCKCSLKKNNSGSWIRVNNLLEEYLKIKIKRVQCTCLTNKESLETVLSYVLKQVSDLIENDFKRLRNLYKCHDSNNLEWNQILNDNNDIAFKESNKKANDNAKPDNLCINRENVSTQGSLNLKIANKSCDAVEVKDTKDIQTSNSNMSLCLNPNEVIITHNYNLHNELPLKSSFLDNNTSCKTEFMGEESLHIAQRKSNGSLISKELNSEIHLSTPYIGFTLNCTCNNNLGSCICSKSLSQAHIKNIEKIWKKIEFNKKLLPNLSYIMHSIPKSVRSENTLNYVEVSEPYITVVPEKRSLHSVKTESVNVDEEITLKNSDDKIQHNDIYDNMTNTLDDFISVTTDCLNDEDTLYWYHCCAVPRNRNEMLHKKSFYESVYSPMDKVPKCGKSDISVKNNVTMCTSKSKNCDCVMVPVCHVKMLVESIETKLVNSQCICDSFNSQVCPLHSKSLHN